MMHSANRSDASNVFTKYERDVRQRLCESDVPYLGLIEGLLDDATTSFIQKALADSGGKLANFEKGLRISPGLFVGYLARIIKDNLGSDNAGSAVYGCINLAMGRKKDAPQNNEERKKLWKAFCHACKKLELPLSNRLYGSNYMVDAYLGQVGVADAYISAVYSRMEKYARENGLPDLDDIGAQMTWYDRFRNSPKNRFGKRTERALMIDNQAYYLSQFLNTIEVAHSKNSEHDVSSINLQTVDKYKLCVPPSFMFDGDELSIILPCNESKSLWQISINSFLEEIEVKGHDKKVALDDFDIHSIELILPNVQQEVFNLWANDINNQFAIFNCDSNVFVGRYDLSEDGVSLSPGRYRILSRFSVSDSWLVLEESYQEGFFVGEFELKAGQNCLLKRGPVSFNICAHSEARMVFEGNEVAPYSGKNFYASQNLALMIELPPEWLRSQSEYELELGAGSFGECRTFPVVVGDADKIVFDLCFEKLGWDPGMLRIRAVLRKKDERRELVKQSALVWLGLRTINRGFSLELSAVPQNFNIEKSKNVREDKTSQCLEAIDHNVQFVELSFDNVGKRSQKFTFALLGTFVYLSDLEEGFRRETLLPLGSTLSSTYNDTRRIRIFSTEDGCLKIGGHTIHESFAQKPWCKPSVASLLDKVERDANTLVLDTPNYTLPILKLVAPHYVDQWLIDVKSRSLDVSFKSPAGIDSFVVDVTNLITLKQHRQILSTDSGACIGRKGEISGLLVNQNRGNSTQLLTLNIDELDDGAWFIRFDSSVNGKWGNITNSRKDHYALGVVVERGRIVKFTSHQISGIRELPADKKKQLFLFVNTELKKCYEENCWNSLEWIKGIWCYLVRDNDVVNDEKLSQILSQSEFSPSDIDSPSWIPQVHMGAFNLTLYSYKSDCYRRIDVKDSVKFRCLKLMGEASKGLSLCLKSEFIAASIVVAFDNRKEVMGDNAEPESLNVDMLAAMLPSVFNNTIWEDICSGEFIPAFGDMLGGAHLAYCQYMFLVGARRAQGGNEFNRPAHNNMVFKFSSGKKDVLPLLVSDVFFESETEKELLESVCYFSSMLAKSCRNAVWNNEEFDLLLERLNENLLGDNTKIEGVLSYYFGVGGDLFHYYLLLWDVYFISRVNVKNNEGVGIDV